MRCGTLVCHWHGLALDGAPFAGWSPCPAHDDGVLVWVRLDEAGGEPPLAAPVVPPRPGPCGAGRRRGLPWRGACEPEDVVANRLDPWHGAWFHPYSFVDLTVVDDARGADAERRLRRRRLLQTRGARSSCRCGRCSPRPGPRTVVMRITEGEGAGFGRGDPRHAARPRRPGPTPDRGGGGGRGRVRPARFRRRHARRAPLLRPLMRAAAGRLWRDDLAYAERRWHLRSTGRLPY